MTIIIIIDMEGEDFLVTCFTKILTLACFIVAASLPTVYLSCGFSDVTLKSE